MSSQLPTSFPRARSTDLATERIDSEIVVYDGVSKDAHYLAPLAAAVFSAADGHTSPADMAAIASNQLGESVDVNAVEVALAELEERGLLVSTPGAGVSRRDMLRRTAMVGGAALAAPLVVSLATPDYGQAGSLSSLSYVVLVFRGSDNRYYRVKWQGNTINSCGWDFATPGTNCEYPIPSAGSQNQGCVPVTVTESLTSGGDTQIRISWTNSGSISFTLVDVRIKCANDCHVVSNPTTTSPSGPYVGCP